MVNHARFGTSGHRWFTTALLKGKSHDTSGFGHAGCLVSGACSVAMCKSQANQVFFLYGR